MSRDALTMRAIVSRSAAQPGDPWGRPGPPLFVVVAGAAIPCRVWSKQRRELRDEGKEVVVDDLRALVSASADVREGDRLTVTNRMGAVLYGGPLAVRTRSIRVGPASRTRHAQLVLERHL